jgi:hypothetical protein
VAEQPTRLRVNLAQREFEVEGSETFVRAYADRIEALLDRLSGEPAAPGPAPLSGIPIAGQTPRSFGEVIHHMPRAASDVDRILAAGHFVQTRSVDKSFGTGEANALLTEQGIKVGNPSQCVKQNLNAKRVFKHQGRYRVSQTGIDYLRQLLGDALPV